MKKKYIKPNAIELNRDSPQFIPLAAAATAAFSALGIAAGLALGNNHHLGKPEAKLQ